MIRTARNSAVLTNLEFTDPFNGSVRIADFVVAFDNDSMWVSKVESYSNPVKLPSWLVMA